MTNDEVRCPEKAVEQEQVCDHGKLFLRIQVLVPIEHNSALCVGRAVQSLEAGMPEGGRIDYTKSFIVHEE